MYLLLISGKNVNTQLHIQTIIRRPFIVLGVEFYFVTAVSGNKVSKMMIFTPFFAKMEMDPLKRLHLPFLNELSKNNGIAPIWKPLSWAFKRFKIFFYFDVLEKCYR